MLEFEIGRFVSQNIVSSLNRSRECLADCPVETVFVSRSNVRLINNFGSAHLTPGTLATDKIRYCYYYYLVIVSVKI